MRCRLGHVPRGGSHSRSRWSVRAGSEFERAVRRLAADRDAGAMADVAARVAAGEAFCPLDAQFFAWRQANGFQAVPALATTSLLAKKVAAGVGRVVLDVRVGPHGNFGRTHDEARAHAERLVAVAGHLGIEA